MTRNRAARVRRAAWVRIGVRGLAVAGLAGAAWLLLGTAAHAASDRPAPAVPASGDLGTTLDGLLGGGSGSALLSPVTDLVAGVVASDSTVDIAAGFSPQPTQTGRQPVAGDRLRLTTGRTGTTGISQVLVGALSPLLSGGGAAGQGPPDSVVRSVQALIAPLGLTGGTTSITLLDPVLSVADAVLQPITDLATPVTASLRDAAAPVTRVVGSVAAPAPRGAISSRRVPGPDGPHDRPGLLAPAAPDGPATALVVSARTAGATAVSAPAPHRAPVAGAMRARAWASAQDKGGQGGAPDQGDLPSSSPLPAALGAGAGGLPASGSGTGQDGGAYAIVPASVANGPAATGRLSAATSVVARRLVVVSPTFSPD